MDDNTKKILAMFGLTMVGYWFMHKYQQKSSEELARKQVRFDGLQAKLRGMQQKRLQDHAQIQDTFGGFLKSNNAMIDVLQKENNELHQKLISESMKPPQVITNTVNVPYPVPQLPPAQPKPELKTVDGSIGLVKRKLNL